MSRWATFSESDLDDIERKHCVPLDAHDQVLSPHIPTIDCPCHPHMCRDGTIVHHDPEHGGYDA